MVIAISGGGTGGHLIIAKNLAALLAKQGIRAIFIGSNCGQDRAWFEGSELFAHTYFLQSSGVVDKKGFAKLASLLNILRLSLTARKILKLLRAFGKRCLNLDVKFRAEFALKILRRSALRLKFKREIL